MPATTFDKTIIPTVLDSVLERARSVLESEAGVTVLGAEAIHCDARKLQLHDLTAIAGLGGPISLLIAFSFERSLLDTIFARVAADIEVPEQEADLYVRDAAAETVNTILGLCTADFQNMEKSIALSPPVIVEDARCIHRPKNAVFASMRVRTSAGSLGVGIVGPRELFDEWLNYQHQGIAR
ncbi:MAG: chemotaxis protein CheX [Actinomycetota bacterium]